MIKILLADADPRRAAVIESRLAGLDAAALVRAPLGSSLREAAAREAPDAVLVALDQPEPGMLDELRALSAAAPRPVILLVGDDDPAFMQAAIAAGVAAYHVVGPALPDVKPIVAAALAMFRKRHRLETELAAANRSLQERRTIAAAKALLMQQRGFGEAQAYRWLRRNAMNANKRIAAVAAELLERAGGEDAGQG